MLYQRYSRPDIFLDEAVSSGTLDTFVVEFWAKVQTEKNERQLWDIWLHKDYENSFKDFKAQHEARVEQVRPKATNEQVASTIANSRNILNSINPS